MYMCELYVYGVYTHTHTHTHICRRKRGRQRMRWLDGTTDSMDEFGWTLGVGDGQGSLVCCGPWGHKELGTAERLN